VSTATGPSIIYHVSDLKEVEPAILDIVDHVLYMSVQRERE
jgi:hypothetical protein